MAGYKLGPIENLTSLPLNRRISAREGLDDFKRPEDLEITRYTQRGYNPAIYPAIVSYLKDERMFRSFVSEGLSEERVLQLIDDVVFIKHIMVIKGCYHQCTFCGQNPNMKVDYMPENDFNYLIDSLEKFVEIAGIPQYHTLSDFSFHRDGETFMYKGNKSQESNERGDLAKIIRRVKISNTLFDRTKKKSDRIRICTAGFYDMDEEKTITTAVKKIVDNFDDYFGTDQQTGSKGGIRFSFHTGALYFKPEGHLGIGPEQWKSILVENFRLLKPLFDDGRFGIRIKEAAETPLNRRLLHNYSTSDLWNLMWETWNAASYGSLEEAKNKNQKIILAEGVVDSGRGKAFDLAEPYDEGGIIGTANHDYLRQGVPVVYIQPNGLLVREVPKTMRKRDRKKNILRTTKLLLPSQQK